MKSLSLFAVLLLPLNVFGVANDECSTSRVLVDLRPGAAWSMQGNSLDKLTWLDKSQKKPTAAEVKKAKEACVTETKDRATKKAQARLDIKNKSLPAEKRLDQLILLLDLDK